MVTYTPKQLNEEFKPEYKYTYKSLLSEEILPGDEKYIKRFLAGKDSIFGEYRVIKYLGRPSNRPWSKTNRNNKKNQITWRIRCNCGLEKDCSHVALTCLIKGIKNGSLKPHCACPHHEKKFKIGTEYDLLKIIGYAKLTPKEANKGGKSNSETWYLKTTCKCGKHKISNPFFIKPSEIEIPLSKGLTGFGCGCKQIKHGMTKTEAYMRWQGAHHRAKIKNLEFDIEIEDCIAPKNCPVFGIPLISNKGKGQTHNSPHVDRLIGSKGYVKNNIVVISNKANSIKNDATVKELRMVADWLEKKLKESQKDF